MRGIRCARPDVCLWHKPTLTERRRKWRESKRRSRQRIAARKEEALRKQLMRRVRFVLGEGASAATFDAVIDARIEIVKDWPSSDLPRSPLQHIDVEFTAYVDSFIAANDLRASIQGPGTIRVRAYMEESLLLDCPIRLSRVDLAGGAGELCRISAAGRSAGAPSTVNL